MKNQYVVIIAGLIVLVLGGLYVTMSKGTTSTTVVPSEMVSETNTETSPTQEASTPSGAAMKSYTLAEISSHNNVNDCWFAVEGKVYDVTKFIAGGKHPGGQAILAGCGKDATSLFMNRPKDGKPHSEMAQKNLQNFYIGELK